MLDLVDETPSNWAFDLLGSWMDRNLITHQRYMAHVSRVIRSLARRGSGVYVGRGAQFLLPRRETLAVRVVAPEPARIERIRSLKNVSARRPAASMRETDQGRPIHRGSSAATSPTRGSTTWWSIPSISGHAGAAELIVLAARCGRRTPDHAGHVAAAEAAGAAPAALPRAQTAGA